MAELRQYRYFLEIARRGSFTAASRTLHITQSALSEQIMQLEREFDTRLFDRGRHGARLTPAGERLVARVEELLRVANEIERTVGQLGTQREALRLGMTMSPLLAWFPTIVAELERTVEGLVCTIEDIATAEIFLQVNTGDLDLGIISTSDPTVAESSSPGLVTTKLFEDTFVLLVPDGHRFTELDAVPLHLLVDERLIAFPRNFSLRVVTDALLRKEGAIVTPTIETGWLEMALRFVAAGLGLMVAPQATVSQALPPGVCIVEIDARDPPKRILAALHRRDGPLVHRVEALLALAVAKIGQTAN